MEGGRGEGGEDQAETLSEEELQWVINELNKLKLRSQTIFM